MLNFRQRWRGFILSSMQIRSRQIRSTDKPGHICWFLINIFKLLLIILFILSRHHHRLGPALHCVLFYILQFIILNCNFSILLDYQLTAIGVVKPLLRMYVSLLRRSVYDSFRVPIIVIVNDLHLLVRVGIIVFIITVFLFVLLGCNQFLLLCIFFFLHFEFSYFFFEFTKICKGMMKELFELVLVMFWLILYVKTKIRFKN